MNFRPVRPKPIGQSGEGWAPQSGAGLTYWLGPRDRARPKADREILKRGHEFSACAPKAHRSIWLKPGRPTVAQD